MQLNLESYYYLGEIGKKNIPTKNKQYNTIQCLMLDPLITNNKGLHQFRKRKITYFLHELLK